MMKSEAVISRPLFYIPGWLPAAVLLAVTAVIGPDLGGAVKPLFLLGSFAVGWYAWSQSPVQHLQAILALLAFAPFVRRVVDVTQGFDPTGIMIAGPLFALMPTFLELRRLSLPGQETDRRLVPYYIYGGCIVYCVALTLANGDWSQAASGALKWGVPFIYSVALYAADVDVDEMIDGAASAFVVLLPIIGIYGIYQYVDPPVWDRYWLTNAAISSAGLPEPYEVRVFSTMNAPGSTATFIAVGLILAYLFRSSLMSRIAIIPGFITLALTLYRTAWISLTAGILFCLVFRATRSRASGVVVMGGIGLAVLLFFTPFADVIGERLSTFSDASNDSSGQERLREFIALWTAPGSTFFGNGFSTADVRSAGAPPTDGMLAACWSFMGIVGGMICLVSIFYFIFRQLTCALQHESRAAVTVGALACGWLVQLPLAGLTSGEIGVLFWTSVTLAMSFGRMAG